MPDLLPGPSASSVVAEDMAGAEDSRDLAAQGYRQELDRTLGSFSAFAAGFSYLSILTGMFQNFHLGYREGGPAFFWTWPAMLAGQLAVALCFAELAAHYPLCGGVYQWSRRVGSPASGWLAGWVYFASLLVTLAAVALALQTTLPEISTQFQFVGPPVSNPAQISDADRAANAVVLGLVLILFSTVINSVGVGLLARINNAGVFAELVGVVVLIVLLAWHAVRGPEVVLDTQGRGVGRPWGYFGAFCAAAVMASYVMYGYDTAGTLAEETTNPRRRAPRAILQALLAAGLAGALVLFCALRAVRDPGAHALSTEGLPWLVQETLGKGVGKVFLCDVAFAITVCVLAVHTGAVRLLFAMARDGNVPFARSLARVSASTCTPVIPAVLTGGLAVAILLANIHFTQVIETLVAVSIVWANLAYLFVTGPLLLRRLRGWAPGGEGSRGGSGARDLFALGAWGLPVNLLAVVWGTVTAVNMGWPRAEVYGTGPVQRYAALLFTAGLVALGGLYYGLVQRHRGKGALHRLLQGGSRRPAGGES